MSRPGITTALRKIQALDKRLRIVQGGSSASKTYSILILLIDLAQRDERPTLTSIVSETFPHLKRGPMRDFLEILGELNLFKPKSWNKTDYVYTFETGSKIEFFSADQPGKVRGPRRNRLFINEANNVPFETFEQLEIRTNEFIFIDYNPVAEFWVNEEIFGKRDDYDHIVLTYKDNEALDESIVKALEARKDRPNFWKVYGLGEFGELEGKIYRGWQIVDEIPHEARLERRGLDFGYCVDNQTEILTRNGWKTYDILTENDEALTLNPQTGLSEWQKINKVNVFKGRYEMWNIEGRSHSSFSTHNHRWLVEARPKDRSYKRKFKTTETLATNDAILCSAQCSNLPNKKRYSDAFVELVAWFWTEGSIHSGGISLWQNEGDHANLIRKALKEFFGDELQKTRNGRNRAKAGWVDRPKRRGNTCHFSINLNGAKKFLEVAPDKIVKPYFINSLTKNQLELFIEVSIKADGYTTASGTQYITQSKKERLESVQMACQLLGKRTTLRKGRNRSKFAHGNEIYTLTIFTKNNRLNIGELIKRRPQYKRFIFEGIVWCPSIKNGTWLARRNGSTYFTGNTIDPSALVDVYYLNGGYILDEQLYQTGMSNKKIADFILDLEHPETLVIADSAEPKSIDEIYSYGVNIRAADKGRDSVRQGIQFMQDLPISVTKRSINLIKEYRNYTWATDRLGKIITPNIPEDAFNHLLDASRYALSSLERRDPAREELKLKSYVYQRQQRRDGLKKTYGL